jgi:hypothetical protein
VALELRDRHKLTMVGTIRKNKREIPAEFVAKKDRPLYSSLAGTAKISIFFARKYK